MIFDPTLGRKYIAFCSEDAIVAGTAMAPNGNKQAGRQSPRRESDTNRTECRKGRMSGFIKPGIASGLE
jgi:hypothetical protein